jgi:hypothetical protein
MRQTVDEYLKLFDERPTLNKSKAHRTAFPSLFKEFINNAIGLCLTGGLNEWISFVCRTKSDEMDRKINQKGRIAIHKGKLK